MSPELPLLDSLTKRIRYGKSFLGVDIGSSSTKIVQLGFQNGEVYVETYGEISNAAYADSEPGRVARPSPTQQSNEISDIVHEVDARTRRCGVAIPFSETLMSPVSLPKRDKVQMDKIVPAEAQRFIPVPVGEIMLDWYVIPEEQANAFDSIKAKQLTEAQFEKVMIVGVNRSIAQTFRRATAESGFSCEFFEIEVFSAVRASLHAKKAPTLILDLGASSTKAAVVNEHWVLLSARMIPIGGAELTGEIMRAQNINFTEAERMKCDQGLAPKSSVRTTLEKALSPVWPYLHQVLTEHNKNNRRPVEHILICGGGSYMPGFTQFCAEKTSLAVEVMQGFGKAKGPMILEETLAADAPRYAIATGLALRGISG